MYYTLIHVLLQIVFAFGIITGSQNIFDVRNKINLNQTEEYVLL